MPKSYYLEYVCVHLRHLFPRLVSYNRFVELEKDVALPLAIFIKKVLLGKCTGISFVDRTTLWVCQNQRIQMHKVFKGIAARGKSSMGWFFGFKIHLTMQRERRTFKLYIHRAESLQLKMKELVGEFNKKNRQIQLRLPDLLMVITGGIMAYSRPDGVKVIPLACLRN
jgi:ISPg3, transposase